MILSLVKVGSLITKFFDERIHANGGTLPSLPLFHSCDVYHLQSILTTNSLCTSECDKFNREKLLYLFYGRPAYKSKHQLQHSKLGFLLPICFILNTNSIVDIRRIFPFDSGAFESYRRFLHPHMTLDDFHMSPSLDILDQTLDFFYDSTVDYYDCKVKNYVEIDPLESPIEAYYHLVKDGSLQDLDDRKASIEIQIGESLQLNSETLLAVVMPEHLAATDFVQRKICDEIGAEIVTYPNYGLSPANYYAEILTTVKTFLMTKNIFNGWRHV